MATILVVDDEPAIVETLTELLTWDGHAVLSASDGERALDQLRSADPMPDLVILDFMMPLRDGIQTLRVMRETQELALVPVLFMTAAPMSLPADGPRYEVLLVKPFGVRELRAAIKKALEPAPGT
jgi:two-component system response regulator MprA